MKKLMYIAVALFALVGCDKNENIIENGLEGTPFKKGQQVTLTVGTDADASQTPNKVAGKDNGTKINFTWEAGDKILVKVGDESAVFTLTTGAGTEIGTFSGIMPEDGSAFYIQFPTETPDLSTQAYTADNPIPADKMLFTAIGCTLDNPATLKAQNAMVQLNLYGTDKIVGKIVFTNKTASPAISYTLSIGGKTIGTASTAATPFYMVVPVGEYMFKVEVWDNTETPAKICSFATSATKTFTAGQCLNMPAKEVTIFVPTYVDLGLPSGLKWATCNVGATKPEEYGDYFAWGETEPYYADTTTNPITWNSGRESGYTWQSYCGQSDFIEWSTPPYDATTKILKPEYDAATANWKGAWRMATYAEWDELKTKCTWAWKSLNGINGYEVEGPNKNTIFLPASGYRGGTSLYGVGSDGNYWSSSLFESYSNYACFLSFVSGSGHVEWYSNCRYHGQSVRPVCK